MLKGRENFQCQSAMLQTQFVFKSGVQLRLGKDFGLSNPPSGTLVSSSFEKQVTLTTSIPFFLIVLSYFPLPSRLHDFDYTFRREGNFLAESARKKGPFGNLLLPRAWNVPVGGIRVLYKGVLYNFFRSRFQH